MPLSVRHFSDTVFTYSAQNKLEDPLLFSHLAHTSLPFTFFCTTTKMQYVREHVALASIPAALTFSMALGVVSRWDDFAWYVHVLRAHKRAQPCGWPEVAPLERASIHATQGPCHSPSLYPRVSDIALLLHTNISPCRQTVLSEEGKFKKQLKYFLTYYLLSISIWLKYVQNVTMWPVYFRSDSGGQGLCGASLCPSLCPTVPLPSLLHCVTNSVPLHCGPIFGCDSRWQRG